MLHQARLFFIALQFLTRVPIPHWVGFQPPWLNAAARYFPLVGTCVGAVAASVLWAAGSVFPPAVAAGLSIVATVLLTGAFHEDGLADTCDALGGAVSRERALEIMKDSRIGSYGTVAIILMLGLKAATLAAMLPALPMSSWIAACLFAHTASRAAPVLLIRGLPYAGSVEHAKAKPLSQRVSRADVTVALAGVAVLGGLCVAANPHSAPTLALSGVALGAATVASAWWLHRRLGGYTGDTLGATQQVTELLVLLTWLGTARWTG